MKHLRLFEDAWNSMEGEYVILKTRKNEYSDFIENNIGIVKKVYWSGSWFSVEYENPPEYIKKLLSNKGEFHVADIVYRSKNREDCEAVIVAKKYNI